MRRRTAIFSLPSLLILAFLLAVIGLMIWRQGGLAFSPGSLSSSGDPGLGYEGYGSHADFEAQCSLCHQPLASLQAELCVNCHISIDQQIANQNSLHGNLENVVECAACHTDHQGRDHDVRLGGLEDFNHSGQSFSLIWHQVDYSQNPIECLGCHVTDDQFSVSNSSCLVCHADASNDFMSEHVQDFGDGCVSCHDGLDSVARFDHANSEFELAGVHQDLSCVECHVEGQFWELQADCVACHAEPGLHLGIFGVDCAACHDSQAWRPAALNGELFDHYSATGFNLELHRQDFSGDTLSCTNCHLEGEDEFTPQTCFECHVSADQDFMVQHQSELGGDCLECHDGVDQMRDFNHQDFFPIDGAHTGIDCQACHVDQVYRGILGECKDCHPEPEIHAGFFGLKCEYCHETTSWIPAQLHSHRFPINHGDQPGEDCQLCHVSSYERYTCFVCHEHSEEEIWGEHDEFNLNQDQLFKCTDCHADGLVHELDDD